MKTKRCKLVLTRRVTKSESEPVATITHKLGRCVVGISYGGRKYYTEYLSEVYGPRPQLSQSKEYDVYLIDPNPKDYKSGDKVVFEEGAFYTGIFAGSRIGSTMIEDETGAEVFRKPIGKILGGTTSEHPSLSPSCVEKFFNTHHMELDVLVTFNELDQPMINKKNWIPIKRIPSSIPTKDIPVNAIRDIICNPYVSSDSRLETQLLEVTSFLNMYNYLIK